MSSSTTNTVVTGTDATVDYHKLINADPDKYILFKQVIVICLPGAGADAISTALKQLDFIVYDVAEMLEKSERDLPLWLEAAEARKAGTPYGRNQFDKLTGRYNALVGAPSAFFAEDLINSYLDTKIVLVTGNVDKSVKTIKQASHFGRYSVFGPGIFGDVAAFTNACAKPFIGDGAVAVDTSNAYTEYIETIRNAAPARRLLEIDEFTSWEPLCKFVGKPVPTTSLLVMEDNLALPLYKHALKLVLASLASSLKIVGGRAYYGLVSVGLLSAVFVGHHSFGSPGVGGVSLAILLGTVYYFQLGVQAADRPVEAANRSSSLSKAIVTAVDSKAEKKDTVKPTTVAVSKQSSPSSTPGARQSSPRFQQTPRSQQSRPRNQQAAPRAGQAPPRAARAPRAQQSPPRDQAAHDRSYSGPVARPPRPVQPAAGGWANFSADIAKDDRAKYNAAIQSRAENKGAEMNFQEKFVQRKE